MVSMGNVLDFSLMMDSQEKTMQVSRDRVPGRTRASTGLCVMIHNSHTCYI